MHPGLKKQKKKTIYIYVQKTFEAYPVRKRVEILFREYCFGEEDSLSLTEFGANSVSSAKNLVSSLWHTKNRLRGSH